MNLREELTAEVGDIYSEVTEELEGPFIEAKFLKQSPTTNAFITVAELTSFYFKYSQFRQNFLLKIGYNGELSEDVQNATHVSIDDEVYIIRNGDTEPPKMGSVTWKFFCDRFPERGQFRNLY